MKGTIELEGLEFHAFHGCLPEEREKGNTFVVDFKGAYDMGAAADSDELQDAVDYSRIYELIAGQMEIPSNLLEHVCARIVRAIAEAFPELEHFSVKLSKLNPPVAGPAVRSSITMEHE